MGNLVNVLMIVVVAGIGGYVFMQKKNNLVQPKWDVCYEESVAGPVATYIEEEGGVPKSWHRQLVSVMSTRRPSPRNLPKDIAALPDLSGTKSLYNLRVAMLRERQAGGSALYKAVRKFRANSFDGLISTDKAALKEMNEIMFLWAGVQNVQPDSRGPFMDGRELAFIEKLFGDPFYQVQRYPNPLPMAAASMKDAFAALRNHYFAEMAAQGMGSRLFAFSGGRPGIDTTVLGILSGRASNLHTPEDKLHFWQGVVGIIPVDVMAYLSPQDKALLERHIRQSAPQLNLKNIMQSLKPNLSDGPSYYDRLGREVIFNIIYTNNMNERVTCFLYRDKLGK